MSMRTKRVKISRWERSITIGNWINAMMSEGRESWYVAHGASRNIHAMSKTRAQSRHDLDVIALKQMGLRGTAKI
jgi:hypothetical protein